jgi:hypothetical protein
MQPSQIRDVACRCGLVIFSLSVADALAGGHWEPIRRDLDVLEVWSGVGSVQRAAASQGLAAAAFDVKHGPEQDLMTVRGFHNVLRLVMRLRPEPGLSQAAWRAPHAGFWC